MRKSLKIASISIAALLLVLLLFLLWAVEPVDYTPYFRTAYYRNTIARLDSVLAQTQSTRGRLQAGWAKVSLTPQLGAPADSVPIGAFREIPLAGYSRRGGRPAEGVHDSLFVRAVALRAGAQTRLLLSWDALIFPVEITEAVLAAVAKDPGLRREQILFSATHTHSGPGAWGEGIIAEMFAGKYNPNVRRWLAQQATAAIRAAVADLQSAQFGHGSFAAPQWVYNRLVGKAGQIDDEFSFVAFRQHDGDFAILGAFAAHATVLDISNMRLSADYPGTWQRAVEQQVPGMAMFFAGAVGSHGPGGAGEGFDRAERLGRALADSVLRLLPAVTLVDTVTLTGAGLRVDLPGHHLRLSDGLRLNPVLARHLIPEVTPMLQVFRIDRLLWIGAPCDFSGELAIDLKNLARVWGFAGLVTSFDGSYVGYVIPGRYYHLDAYESRLMSFFGPYMGPYFDELIRRLMLGMIL